MKRLLVRGSFFLIAVLVLSGCGAKKKNEKESIVLTVAETAGQTCVDDPNTATVAEKASASDVVVNGFRFKACDEMLYVSGDGIMLREKPGKDGKILGHLTFGTEVQRTGKNSKWSRILVNGKTRYIATEYLAETPPAEKNPESTMAVSAGENTDGTSKGAADAGNGNE